MAPLAFYDALAASASVFIGILTALLISNLSTMTTARGRIYRRIMAIDARRESLTSRRDRLKEDLERIEGVWDSRAQQDAKENVEDFIDRYVGSEFIKAIEHVNLRLLIEKLADYLEWDVEDLNQYHEEELQAQMAEIEAELVDATVENVVSDYEDLPHEERTELEWDQFREDFKSRFGIVNLDEKTRHKLKSEYDRITPDPTSSQNMISPSVFRTIAETDAFMSDVSMPVSDEIYAAQMRREDQQRIHEENQYHQNENQYIRAVTEIDALETERSQLVAQFKSLDPTQLRNAIHTSVGTILASVLFPLIIHLLHVLGWILRVPESLTVLEPIVVFSGWRAWMGIPTYPKRNHGRYGRHTR